LGLHAPGLAFQKGRRAVVRALKQFFNGASFVGWLFGFSRLLLLLLRKCSLEFWECHPLRNTYCMNAQMNLMDA
jgi:hypothetical protein